MSISEVEVAPLAIGVETTDDELTVSLADGRRISVPLVWFPRLLDATPLERADFRLLGGGEGIHWPRVDEDISITGLLRGAMSHEVGRSAEPEYRRADHSNVWHWLRDCSTYPKEDYFVRRARPDGGELCNECQQKTREAESRIPRG